MGNQIKNFLAIGTVIIVGLVFFSYQKNNKVKPIEQKAVASNETKLVVYENKTYGYSWKFPTTYEVPSQTAGHISQIGLDNNIGIQNKANPSSGGIVVDIVVDDNNTSLKEYVNNHLSSLWVMGPVENKPFNNYDSLIDKGHKGSSIFIKRGKYIYHISAPTSSTNKEIESILKTFTFIPLPQTAESRKAITLLQENESIQYIQRIIFKNGRKSYFETQNESGNVVEVSLIEEGFPDKHTTTIDTFFVNAMTDEILVLDVVNNTNVPLKEWNRNITQRFPDYGPKKVAEVLVQDGSFYGPPFDVKLFQLEISKSEHLFAKSDTIDLKKYLGKRITVGYREVRGVIMTEQQLVTVDSVE